MKRLQAAFALLFFLIPSGCDRGLTEPESLGPEVPSPSFAIKGKTGEIVYTGGSAAANDLFLLDLNLKTVTNLTNGSGTNQMAEWSPSGDSIVYSAGPVGAAL